MMERDERAAEIAANVAEIEARVAAACARAGRPRKEVLLLAVSKTFSAPEIDQALAAGIREVGENRVQEARDKQPEVALSARWHLIGHLQSNKVKDAVRLFDVIQTADSVALAQKISAAALAAGKRQEILLQVNIGREAQKSGADPDETIALAASIRELEGVHLRGLMAIPPAADLESTRRCFRELRQLRDELALPQLSMGMSEDFEAAIEEGSTIVRVGRAIFGSRPPVAG